MRCQLRREVPRRPHAATPTLHVVRESARGAADIVSSLVGAGTFAYLIGYGTAKSYYSEFGASWLFSSATSLQLLQFSATSVTPFILFLLMWLQTAEHDGQFMSAKAPR